MNVSMVSVRCPLKDFNEALELCEKNEVDISNFVVTSLIHFVNAHANKGVIPTPRFLSKKLDRRRLSRKSSKKTTS